jgi:hypothetical protein
VDAIEDELLRDFLPKLRAYAILRGGPFDKDYDFSLTIRVREENMDVFNVVLKERK